MGQIKESKLLNEKYYYTRLSSGLDVYVFPKDLSASYAIIGTRYGSVHNCFKTSDDSDFISYPEGIAHFLEHKLLENEDGVDAFEQYAQTGANANAFTSFMKTAYLFSVTENFYETLEILLGFVTKPFFNAEKVKKEQGIIAQEIMMGRDNPKRKVFYNLMEAMYETHPVREDIAGSVESISEITPEILYKCYYSFYTPDNMVLCVCGNVDEKKTLDIAEKYFPHPKSKNVQLKHFDEKREVFKEKTFCKMDVSKPLFSIGVKNTDIKKDPYERMKSSAGMSILCEMLFSKSERFYNSLYERGILSHDYSYGYEENRSFSFFEMSGESSDPEGIYSELKSYIKSKQSDGLLESEFERCRKVIYAESVRGFDSTEDIAVDLLSSKLDCGDPFDYIDIIGDIKFDYIKQMLNDKFKDEYFCLSVVFPENE